jgi:hypothetical protein
MPWPQIIIFIAVALVAVRFFGGLLRIDKMTFSEAQRVLIVASRVCMVMSVLALIVVITIRMNRTRIAMSPTYIDLSQVLVAVGIGIGPHLVLRRYRSRFLQRARGTYDAFMARIGPVDYATFVDGTGIAISNSGRQIHLIQDKEAKTYSFDDVRGCEYIFDSSGTPAMRAQKHLEDLRLGIDTIGIFIRIKDVGHPIWHLRFRSKKMIDQWREILNQSMPLKDIG